LDAHERGHGEPAGPVERESLAHAHEFVRRLLPTAQWMIIA
jgi:hypothetical protein